MAAISWLGMVGEECEQLWILLQLGHQTRDELELLVFRRRGLGHAAQQEQATHREVHVHVGKNGLVDPENKIEFQV